MADTRQRLRRVVRAFASSMALLVLTQCGAARFYSQAARGQWEILSSRVPVRKLLEAPETEPSLKRQFQTTESLRAFARDELHLPADGQYNTYSDVHRRHLVWVVMAAPEFSTEPKRWWYPIVGKLDYRGYFSQEGADKLAGSLRAEGLDVVVGGVDAYSTLGFFSDPLLNTFIHDPDVELAELLFHELTHQKVFLSGDTDFNEAFATANSQEGVRRWLRSQKRWSALRHYNEALREEQRFSVSVLALRNRLQRLYAETAADLEVVRREKKAAAIAEFRDDCLKLGEIRQRKAYQNWFSKPVNNARLNTINSYQLLVPGFHRLLAQCHGDLDLFYATVKAMKSLTKEQRKARLLSSTAP